MAMQAYDTDYTTVELFPKFNVVLIGISILTSAVWFVFYQKHISHFPTRNDTIITIKLTSTATQQVAQKTKPILTSPTSSGAKKPLPDIDKQALSAKEQKSTSRYKTDTSTIITTPPKTPSDKIDKIPNYAQNNVFNPRLQNAIEKAKSQRNKSPASSKPLSDARQFEAAREYTSYRTKNGCKFRSMDLGDEQRFFIVGCNRPDEIKLEYHHDGPKYPSFDQ